MDSELIIQALNYHGQEFRRALDSEAVSDIFENIDMREVDYLQYHRRAKEFGFQERNQRQKLHKFLGRKAHLVYMPISNSSVPMEVDFQSDEVYAIMPPVETYMNVPGHERKKHFYEMMKKGDPVIGIITALQNYGFVITLICTDGGKRRQIYDLGIKCFCTVANALVNNMHDNAFSSYHVKALVRGAVLNELANPLIERLYISMKTEHLAFQLQSKLKMGAIAEEDAPIHYRRSIQFKDKSYSEVLEWNFNFNNPTNLYQIGESLGLNIHKTESFFKHLHSTNYGKEEYAYALRKLQSSKWAFKRIRDGVTQFKAGNHTEAYQCLNKALYIDPESVEGLVARGALFANNKNLVKAVEDFERALEINPQHGNAQKYLSETLVVIGKCCHEKGDFDEACKSYKKAILINGSDEAKEALASAEKSLNSKDTVANIAFPSSSNNILSLKTHPTTTNLVDADTRQKLLFLLQDDKEKLFSKDHQQPASSDIQSSPPTHKIPLPTSSPKSNASKGAKVWFGNDGMKYIGKSVPDSADRKDMIIEKKKAFGRCANIQDNNDQLSCIDTRVQDEGAISLEERLKEYYKKVGENKELKRSPTEEEISPEKSHKMSQKPTKYERESSGPCKTPNSTSVSSCSFSTSGNKIAKYTRKGVWTEQQSSSKCEHKRHIKIVPFSDHFNSSCKRPKIASEKKKGTCVIKMKSYKTVNSENCSELLSRCLDTKDDEKKKDKEIERSVELVIEASHRSCNLNVSHRNLELSHSASSHYELNNLRKSQLPDKMHHNRKYNNNNTCRKSSCSDNDFYNSHKRSYNTSSRYEAHSSLYYHTSHLSENKLYRNYHYVHKKYSPPSSKTVRTLCKLNSSQNLEANHKKDRGMISRALDPEILKRLKESAKLSRVSGVKSQSVEKRHINGVLKVEENSALEAAMAAAQKITDALQDTTPPNESHDQMDYPVMSAKQRQTLQQMEMFLEKLKSQKKTETSSNNKHD